MYCLTIIHDNNHIWNKRDVQKRNADSSFQSFAYPTFRPFIKFHCHMAHITLFWCDFWVPKCTIFKILWGSAEDLAGGAYSASPDPAWWGGSSCAAPSLRNPPALSTRVWWVLEACLKQASRTHAHILFHGTAYANRLWKLESRTIRCQQSERWSCHMAHIEWEWSHFT